MLTDAQLREKLGADVYDALMAKLKAAPQVTANEFRLWVHGAYRSWTNWFGAFLIAWPSIEPQLSTDLQNLLGNGAGAAVIRWIGVVVILLRFKTTNSVKDKAKPKGVTQ